MNKFDIINKIKEKKIIAVIRYNDATKIERIVESIILGGITIIEITMTVPNAVEIIKSLSEKYKNTDVVIGAGTILSREEAKTAIESGSSFIVSPILNEDMIKICTNYNILCIPGIATPTEAFNAMQYGAEILKLFPSNSFSPKIIKTYKGPFPEIKLLPTGGISIENINEWINAGAYGVGIGGELLKGFDGENYSLITSIAENFNKKTNL